MSQWNLNFDGKLLKMTGRTYTAESIFESSHTNNKTETDRRLS